MHFPDSREIMALAWSLTLNSAGIKASLRTAVMDTYETEMPFLRGTPGQANEVVILKALSRDFTSVLVAFSTKENLQTRNSKIVLRVHVNSEQKRKKKVLCMMV